MICREDIKKTWGKGVIDLTDVVRFALTGMAVLAHRTTGYAPE